MEQLLSQIVALLLGAIPTVVMLLVIFVAYNRLLHRPLEAVLAERYARTEGAIEKARADIAAAEARTAEYEQRLREARMSIFKIQEARRQKAQEARAAAVAEARAAAEAGVREARATLQRDAEAARAGLEAESERLAQEIIRSILRPVQAAESPAVGVTP